MSHAPWIYGWWAVGRMAQAHVLLAETIALFCGYLGLALWGLSMRGIAPAGDPAERMMHEDDPGGEDVR